MDTNFLQARAAPAHLDSNWLHQIHERSAPQQTCTHDKNGHLVCKKKDSFFKRVGKFILIAVLIFVFLCALCCLCCCLKMRKKKTKNIDNGGGQKKGGLFGMFGKKNQDQQYNLQTAQPNGVYGQPPQPPQQAHV